VIRRAIVFSPEARADLLELYDWVATADAIGKARSGQADSKAIAVTVRLSVGATARLVRLWSVAALAGVE